MKIIQYTFLSVCLLLANISMGQSVFEKLPKSEFGVYTSYIASKKQTFWNADLDLMVSVTKNFSVGGFWKYSFQGRYKGATTNWNSELESYGAKIGFRNKRSKWKGLNYGVNASVFKLTVIQTPPSSEVSELKMGHESIGFGIEPYLLYNLSRKVSIPLFFELNQLSDEVWYESGSSWMYGVKTGVIFKLGKE